MFHAVFTYSNWEYVHLCHSESFEALSAGLQDALHLAGGAPRRVRSDSLSAAPNKPPLALRLNDPSADAPIRVVTTAGRCEMGPSQLA